MFIRMSAISSSINCRNLNLDINFGMQYPEFIRYLQVHRRGNKFGNITHKDKSILVYDATHRAVIIHGRYSQLSLFHETE